MYARVAAKHANDVGFLTKWTGNARCLGSRLDVTHHLPDIYIDPKTIWYDVRGRMKVIFEGLYMPVV